jgi:cyclase
VHHSNTTLEGPGLVKGVAFGSWRRIGTAMLAVKVLTGRDVDELVLLDITAREERRDLDYATVVDLAAERFLPLTVGGGIDSVDKIRWLLRAGTDKVVINSGAYARTGLIRAAADTFGSQCIVVSVDARAMADGTYQCLNHCGCSPTGKAPADWALEVERSGWQEMLLTSIERDGTMQGYHLALVRPGAAAVTIPVIAAGGLGSYEHMHEVLAQGMESAVAAERILELSEQTPAQAKEYLAQRGLPVRRMLHVAGHAR